MEVGDGARRQAEAFKFISSPERKYPSLSEKSSVDCLMKWSMKGRLMVHAFSFDENFCAYKDNEFMRDLFNSDVVKSVLHADGSTISSIKKTVAQPVACTWTNMKFFQKLKDITCREDGTIKRCYDDMIHSVLVSDELRRCLIDEESENYQLIADEERQEFLFQLFSHICIGGELCQSEDNINDYIEFSRRLYRDLISVQKCKEGKEVQVISKVYAVKVYITEGYRYLIGP
ncbi:unnamed protein product [Calicophoron daubneyi]|uniref:Cilia- and flagella-associated protein 300 n=1 Tax=Calicophoron daubneyi TaxID=300641 RepID=A0AAV2TZG0_CALDB